MSGQEWTPTTTNVASVWVGYGEHDRASRMREFDRWLAEHDREVAARAWDEGAETTWQATGEGWNGEYGAGLDEQRHNPPWSAVASSMPTNPYRKEAGA